MAGLIYFFPRVQADQLKAGQRINRAFLERYDLAGVLGDIRDVDAETSLVQLAGAGPSGASGVVIQHVPAGTRPVRCGYLPEWQRWEKVLDEPELWAGVDKEYPPTAADLARPRQIPGHWVELADAQRYLVPVIRSPRGTMLPRTLRRMPDRSQGMDVRPEYRRIWDESEAAWDVLMAGGEMEYSVIRRMCLDYLAVNYRIGEAENAILGLLDTANWQEVFGAACDVPFMQELVESQKKSESSSPAGPVSSEPGPAEGSPDTSQVAVTSTS